MKLPSIPLFTDTFTAETVHLSNEQVGIYIRLLCFAWTKNAKPFTTQSANRICQCKTIECEGVVLEVLDEFFIRGDNRNTWTHKRISSEYEYLQRYYLKKVNQESEEHLKDGMVLMANQWHLYLVLYLFLKIIIILIFFGKVLATREVVKRWLN